MFGHSCLRRWLAAMVPAVTVLVALSSRSSANPIGFVPLPDDNPGGTVAQGINDAGDIVGGSNGSFLYSSGNFTNFNVPPTNISSAFGINDQGQIVGGYEQPAGTGLAFVGTPAGVTTIIPPFAAGSTGTTATGINNAGVIVGAYNTGAGTPAQGFIDNAGHFTTFNVPGASSTALTGINSSGELAGYYISGGTMTGFSADANGKLVLTVPGGYVSGINNAGQIVGWIGNSGFVDTSGTIQSVNVDGASFSRVSGINNSGQIVGYYDNSSGEHSFVAMPVGNETPVSLPNFHGGPPSNPTPLPVGYIIGSVSDTLNSPFVGDWYTFNWPGPYDDFNAIVSITGAPAGATYTVELVCQSLVGALCPEPPPFYDQTLDSSDGFTANINFSDFYIGTWQIGILGADTDPDLTIDFVTPVEGVAEGVPEPCSLAFLGVGLGGLAALRRRKRCLRPRSFSATP